MPQMAPLSWIFLNISFSLLLLMYISMMYYIPMYMISISNKSSYKKKILQMSFKW